MIIAYLFHFDIVLGTEFILMLGCNMSLIFKLSSYIISTAPINIPPEGAAGYPWGSRHFEKLGSNSPSKSRYVASKIPWERHQIRYII